MPDSNSKLVSIWFVVILVMLYLIILIGGVTRLTGSGLSIVEWAPILGTIPPLNEVEWLKAFEQYKAFPQFNILNENMTLDGFKFIFFWEYFHRLFARSIGFVVALPWLFFWVTGRINKTQVWKYGLMLVIGGLQGIMGWLMVKSGLIDKPHVSHFRLAAHLMLALLILCYTLWLFFDLKPVTEKLNAPRVISKVMWVFFFVLNLQIIYGAFVAGLKAGFSFNTFPTMNGEWFPSLFFQHEPHWVNFFENTVAVQFVHRVLGLLLLVIAGWIFKLSFNKNIDAELKKRLKITAIFTWFQFLSGVVTLLMVVPVGLGSMHQVCAAFLLSFVVWTLHRLKSCEKF